MSLLQGRFHASATSNIQDVYSGEAYLKHMTEGGFLRVPTNISLTMNTDGAQVFHSSNISLWPLYFIINELPANLRCYLIVRT